MEMRVCQSVLFFDDPAMQTTLSGLARIAVPVMAANALDHPWAPPSSGDAFGGLPKCQAEDA
jgi:predicted alpha/beta hydrolase